MKNDKAMVTALKNKQLITKAFPDHSSSKHLEEKSITLPIILHTVSYKSTTMICLEFKLPIWKFFGCMVVKRLMSSMVFENHRKSLIQHCERSELRLHFEWTKVN